MALGLRRKIVRTVMPQEDEKNRRPPRGINLAEKHVQKHLPDTPQMLKQLKEDGKAHVFNDRQTLITVTQALFESGQLVYRCCCKRS